MESNKSGNDFTILNVALKIPEKLKQVIESMARITNRDLDDLCSVLIIDQLNFFHQAKGEILRYMKDYESFSENLAEGIKHYCQLEPK